MKFFISVVLAACFSLTYANAQLQNVHTINGTVGELVSLSFRLGYDSEQFLIPLKRKVDSLRDKRLSAYHGFVYKAWQRYFVATSPAEKEKLSADIDAIRKHSPYEDLRAHVLFWQGVTALFHIKQNETESLSSVLKAKKLMEELHYENFPYVANYYSSLADVYSYFGDAKSAVLYTEKLLLLPATPLFGRQSQYNNIGVFYVRLKEYGKAEEAFHKGLAYCRQNKLISFGAMIQGNLGNLHRLRGAYREALPYLSESVTKTEKEIPENAALAKLYLADCLLHLDSVEKAASYLKPPGIEIPYWSQPTYNLTWYEVHALYHLKAGNLLQTVRYKDSLAALKDSIKDERDEKKIIVLESSLQAEQFMNERTALETGRYWRNIFIILLALIFIAVVGWLLQRRRQERQLSAQKETAAKEMLKKANDQLQQYLQSIKEKNELIDQIKNQLEQATAGHKMNDADKDAYLQTLQNSTLFTDADWERFKQLFDQVFPGFFAQLLQQHPELSPAELRLLALEKLALNDKEKGAMLNISPDSVKKARYRLRKKCPGLLDVPVQVK